jgi:hypothetical protein
MPRQGRKPVKGLSRSSTSIRLRPTSRGKREARAMTKTLYKLDERRNSSLDQVREAPASAFKPLALPAVVAAVRIVAQSTSHKPGHRELPAERRRRVGSN